MNITSFITNQFMKKKEKNINLFIKRREGKRNPKFDSCITDDDASELSGQIVFS